MCSRGRKAREGLARRVRTNSKELTPSGAGIRVQKARKPGSGRPMWLVLGDDCLPIGPIDEFLTFLDVTGSSPNTIRAYAHHLKLYWEYLTESGLDWRGATLQDIGTSRRPRSTCIFWTAI